MKKLKVGIIGCGNIFPMHAFPVNACENAQVTAVCDIKETRAVKKAKEFNCSYYVDYKEMIDKEDIDVVHICTPHYLHAPMAIYAANAKKNILTEKPMALSMKDARNMIQTARDNNVVLGVIFQNRYNPGSLLIKKALESGELGKIRSGKLSVTWDRADAYYSESDWKGTWDKEGGGVIIDQAIHTMDLMRWFIDSEIEFVEANIGRRAHDLIEVEDIGEGFIKFKNGVGTSFFVINYYTCNSPVEIELHCDNGFAKMAGYTARILLDNGKEYAVGEDPNETFSYGDGTKGYWGVSHVKQIKDFYRCLGAGIAPAITGEEALKTQEMICAIYEAAKSKKRIKL